MLSPEGIKISKGEWVTVEKRVVPLIDSAPKSFPLNREGDTVAWLCKWHRFDQQEKGQLRNYQEILMGYVLNIQASIGRGGRDEGG